MIEQSGCTANLLKGQISPPKGATDRLKYSFMISRRRFARDALTLTLGASWFRDAWPELTVQPSESPLQRFYRQAEPAILQRPDKWVRTFGFDANGTRVALGYEGGTVLLWPTAAANAPTVITAHKGGIDSIKFGPEGDHFFTYVNGDDDTRVWDAATGTRLHTIPKVRGPVLATDMPGTSLMIGSAIHLYHHPTRRLSPPSVPTFRHSPVSLAYHAGSRTIAVGTASGTLELWRIDGNDVRAEIWRSASMNVFRRGWVSHVWFSRQGDRIWLRNTHAVEEWSVEPLMRLKELTLELKSFYRVAVDDSGSLLAIVGNSQPDAKGVIGLQSVSLPEGRSLGTRPMPWANTEAMTFLPGTRTLVLTSGGRLIHVELK